LRRWVATVLKRPSSYTGVIWGLPTERIIPSVSEAC
jgi:hypothetical protein